MADKDLSALLAELGGDNPQNRAIAEGLQKQGVSSTKDIAVEKVLIPRHMEGTDEAANWVDDSYTNAYVNKATGEEIDPTRIGIIQNGTGGVKGGDIFFHLNADDNGNVNFQPQWSPRAHGYLRDNPVGQAIMSIGKILPVTSPFFIAASAADAAAHGNYGAAIAQLVPMGLQQLAAGTDVLTGIAGPDFNPMSVTPGGQIAEALGVPVQVADQVGKSATAAVKAGLSGKDAGRALIESGIGSIVGSGSNYLKGVGGDILKNGLQGFGGEDSFSADELAKLNEDGLASLPDTRFDENGLGDDLAVDMRADENGLGNDLAVDMRADENGIAGLDNKPVVYDDEGNLMPGYELDEDSNPVWVGGESEYSLEGGAGSDYVSSPSEGDIDGTMVGDAGDVTDKTDLGTVTISAKREPWEPEGGWEGDGWGTIGEGGFGDDGGTFTVGEGGTAYKEPIDPYGPLKLPPGAEPDEAKPEEPYLLNPEEPPPPPKETPPKEPVLKVPPIFPPKTTPPTTNPPKGPGGYPLPKDGLDDIIKGLVGGTIVGGVIDGLNKPETPTTPATPLKGNYNFSWNKQETKGPEKGIAYGQKYYGSHWNQSEPPKTETPKTEPRKEFSTMPVENLNITLPYMRKESPVTLPEPPANEIQFAEGGLMTLGGAVQHPTFKPTMVDSGIEHKDLMGSHVANQAIQHMRRGGHVIDHNTHKAVKHLASKGEPVHHIVGFMNHRKRMAEGGITSHSLGSYSDGGHLLKGPGDGMSDDIPATIADKQPARLANEEFVIPADVVSHLGNGSSESGAKVLYDMMARIRKARTGNPKQGKQIDPHKLLPKV